MQQRRRRSKAQQQQHQQEDTTNPQPDDLNLAALKLPAPFELEDFQEWWSTPAAAAATEQENDFDSVVDPLLHFGDEILETQSTLKGICSPVELAAAAAAAPIAPVRSKKGKSAASTAATKNQTLGVEKKNRAISPRESHILSERQRRKGMNHLFTTLGSLLPDTSSKSDKSTIVSEIIAYIQNLRKDLEELGKKRAEAMRLPTTSVAPIATNKMDSSSISQQSTPIAIRATDLGKQPEMQSTRAPNVVLSSCGSDIFITISTPKAIKNLLSRALMIIQQHKFTLLDGNISTNSCMIFHYFHVKALDPQQLLADDTLQNDLQSLMTLEPTDSISLSEPLSNNCIGARKALRK